VFENIVLRRMFGYKKEEVSIMRSFKIHQNYWVSGLFPSSGILNIREHNILKIGYVSILRQLRLTLSKGLNTVDVSSPHLRTEPFRFY
jgi:hypothetical protein